MLSVAPAQQWLQTIAKREGDSFACCQHDRFPALNNVSYEMSELTMHFILNAFFNFVNGLSLKSVDFSDF